MFLFWGIFLNYFELFLQEGKEEILTVDYFKSK